MSNMMRVRWIVGWVVVFTLVAAIGYAQEPPIRSLSIADAMAIAYRNNPDYQTAMTERWSASAGQRAALLNLLTPSVTLSAGQRHTQQGSTVVTGFAAPIQSPANTGSSWSLSGFYSLSGQTFATRGLAMANADAADADIDAAQRTLETNVRSQYLTLLQAKAQAQLAQRSLERAQQALELAQARYQVGQATLIDVRTGEVGKATADVNLLTANQTVENQTLVLFQALGVPAPEPIQLELTDSFPVTQPAFNEDSLVRLAIAGNPTLLAARARLSSAKWLTRSSYSSYGPSLQVSGGLGGFRQSIDSNTVTNAPPSSSNGSTPFSFTIGVSIPIYDGLARAYTISQNRAAEESQNQFIRKTELAVRAQVAAAYRGVIAAYQKIGLQATSKSAASEALDLAQQRYRVGAGTYLDMLIQRDQADQADANYISAVYDYHRAIATLEQAVGRPLR